jgi:hypothetical protein
MYDLTRVRVFIHVRLILILIVSLFLTRLSQAAPAEAMVMPLVAFLQQGSTHKPFGWHRNEERQARGWKPLVDLELSSQLEEWERQLAVVETLLLGGGTPYANFQHLAHGWGRQKGFHSALITNVCQRRGDIIRKRRNEFVVWPQDQEHQAEAEAEVANEANNKRVAKEDAANS